MILRWTNELDFGRRNLRALTSRSNKPLAVLLCALPVFLGCTSKYDAYMSDQKAAAYCERQANLVETNIGICSRMLMQPRLYVKPCLDAGEIPGSPRFAECALQKIRIDQSRSEAREKRDKKRQIETLEDEVRRMNQEKELGRLKQERN